MYSEDKKKVKQRKLGRGSPDTSRSLSVSTDSDARNEPQVLREVHKSSAAASASAGVARNATLMLKKGTRTAHRRFRGTSSSRSSGSSIFSFSQPNDSKEPPKKTDPPECQKENPRQDEPPRILVNMTHRPSILRGAMLAPSTAPSVLTSRPSALAGSESPTLKTTTRRCRAVANVSKELAAIQAERLALHDMQNPVLDTMETEIQGLQRQLADVKESLHKRCLCILNSLVENKWTIDTNDTLAKRMLRPSKWAPKSQVQVDVQEDSGESEWFGPSALDVFGDCLVASEKNPYKIVGVFARRYWDTRKRPPYLDELLCSPLLPCLQQAAPPCSLHQRLEFPIEAVQPIKAFTSQPTSSRLIRSKQIEFDGYVCEESVMNRGLSLHLSPHNCMAPMPAPTKASWGDSHQAIKNRQNALCAVQLPSALSGYVCVMLPAGDIPPTSEPESYPKASVEISNMRIPSLLSDYLQKNSVNIERPKWDKTRRRKRDRERSETKSTLSAGHSDGSDSSCEEEGDDQDALESEMWGTSNLREKWDSIPQFLRREVGNRLLPTIFSDVDVRISETWKLENMEDKEKAAWVYQGSQTGPKPYPWEEVPMKGRPLSREEITKQRRDAAARRRMSKEGESLLRSIEQNEYQFTDDGAKILRRGHAIVISCPSSNAQRRGCWETSKQGPLGAISSLEIARGMR